MYLEGGRACTNRAFWGTCLERNMGYMGRDMGDRVWGVVRLGMWKNVAQFGWFVLWIMEVRYS